MRDHRLSNPNQRRRGAIVGTALVFDDGLERREWRYSFTFDTLGPVLLEARWLWRDVVVFTTLIDVDVENP